MPAQPVPPWNNRDRSVSTSRDNLGQRLSPLDIYPCPRLKARHLRTEMEQRHHRLYSAFDAYVLGAVESSRHLIGGKLTAFCAVANETADYLRNKYAGKTLSRS